MSKYQLNANIKFKETVNNSEEFTVPSITDYESKLAEIREDKLLGMSNDMERHYALTAYASIYSKVSMKLKQIITAVEEVRSFYLVDVMLSQMAEDALAPRIGSEDIVRYSVASTKIQKELDDLKKKIGLDQLIENIAPDLLAYGEYTLATKIDKPDEAELTDELGSGKKFKKQKNGSGIEDVTDIIEQGTVISLTQDGRIEGYLQLNEFTGKVEVKEVADFIKFSLGGQRVRLNVREIIPAAAWKNPELKKILDKIPRFIRVGKSVLYPVLSKIKELELLEKLVPATKLNKLSQGNIVGMSVPDNYDLKEAFRAVRQIEGMVNKKISVDPSVGEITVESILSTAGKTKIIPLFGDKGSLDKLDYKSDEPDDLMGSAKEIRELILDSVGVPSELVFKSDGDGKADILKRYAKYLRKLKRLQKSIVDGCRQIAFIHLANKGIKFKEEEIEVHFNNNLIEIDNLDRLEHADVTLSLLSNVRDFFNDMSEEDSPYQSMTDLNKVVEYIESNLKTIGLADAIKLPKEGGKDADKSKLDVDGVDSQGAPTSKEPTEEPAPEDDDSKEFEKEKGDTE